MGERSSEVVHPKRMSDERPTEREKDRFRSQREAEEQAAWVDRRLAAERPCTAADFVRQRLAQERQARKVARQAKGFITPSERA